MTAPRKKNTLEGTPPFEPDNPETVHYVYPTDGRIWCEYGNCSHEAWKCPTGCKRFFRGHTVTAGKSAYLCAAPVEKPFITLSVDERTAILNVVYQGLPPRSRTITLVAEHYRNAVRIISEAIPKSS